ncbi:MAG TPA: hypothetical protein VHA76_06270 [Solirubrobacterales bacterium]|nr:hypothetical protein [Solirubrobacterales bacterium]
MARFREQAAFSAAAADWEFLPFRFERLDGRVLVTNVVGEHTFLRPRTSTDSSSETCPPIPTSSVVFARST